MMRRIALTAGGDSSATLYDGDPEGKVEWDLSSLGSVEFEELSD